MAAGERLDRAALHFRRLCDCPHLPPEEIFAAVENEYLAARAAYMSELATLTGEAVEDIEKRVLA